ncbi:hypothetical protein FGG08_001204 [Glutinoglossum americanum]|uniref:[acyl-carrier-protein] S-malonyltransferase n=1 Tax=Glutinoglossum americanum TaxID=1670608 RepID=A0A9P8I7E3_9PEZI|nr:hypothetical protein FGG08_001204 [Glutinoglossum americanum]
MSCGSRQLAALLGPGLCLARGGLGATPSVQHHFIVSLWQWQRQWQQQNRTPSRRWASTALRKRSRTAIFFPGQGVQRVGMTIPWLEAFPTTARPILEEIDHILQYPLARIIADGTNADLTATENAQPAIMATSIMILRILEKEFGFNTTDRVDFTLGHSLGEFAALVAGGYLRNEDALRMVHKRAQAMARCSRRACEEGGGTYGMVAVVCEPDRLEPMIESIHEFLGHSSIGAKVDSSAEVPTIQQVLIANINSKNQIVLSGRIERIKTLLTHLRQFAGHDPRAITLKSEVPFHSPLMKPAVKVMRRMLDERSDMVTYPTSIPCVSNVTARAYRSRGELKDLLARSCAETVLWAESIRYLDQEEKVRRWIGIGPGKVGRNLVGKEVGMRGRDIVKGGGVWGISDPREIEDIMRALELTEQAAEEEEE